MTLDGAVHKSGLLLLMALITAAISWNVTVSNPSIGAPISIGGVLGGAVVGFILCFNQRWAPFLAPAYAVLEGCFLGAISSVFNHQYQGIVFQAAGLTLGVLALMLVAYRTGILRATERFQMVVFCATGAIALSYLVSMILGFFGKSIPFIHQSGWLGIGFSVVVVTVASLNLILDFALIETGVRQRAPKYMEWYAGFSLLVTIVWLYLEILRLLSKLNSRNR